jgi:hypothetical protein
MYQNKLEPPPHRTWRATTTVKRMGWDGMRLWTEYNIRELEREDENGWILVFDWFGIMISTLFWMG